MPELIASPDKNTLYLIEKGRLSTQVLSLLEHLNRKPTRDNLKLFETRLNNTLAPSLLRVAKVAYIVGAKDVGFAPDNVAAIALEREINARSKQAANWIAATTGVALDITAAMSRARAISSGRADLIAINNLAVSFFRGTRFGWGLDENSLKSWYVSDAHDNDDTCDDNEDDGPIPINEPFQSGDFEPPAHIGCNCLMRLARRRKL